MNETQPQTNAERQAGYRERLDAAGKAPMRIVVRKDVARKLHAMAHANVEPIGDVLAKAMAALEAITASQAVGAAAADESLELLATGAAEAAT